VSKDRHNKVIDIPLDFADWASGPVVRSAESAPDEVRARVDAAFAAADDRATQRLTGTVVTKKTSDEIVATLVKAGIKAGKAGTVADYLTRIVSRERDKRVAALEAELSQFQATPRPEPPARWVRRSRGRYLLQQRGLVTWEIVAPGRATPVLVQGGLAKARNEARRLAREAGHRPEILVVSPTGKTGYRGSQSAKRKGPATVKSRGPSSR
jgi:hypothetical protein